MRPILSRKVTRGDVLNEWEPAAHQSTMDGLRAFQDRQLKRIEAAQKDRDEAKRVVRTIRKVSP
jgi:hypothetical protein